MRRRITPTGYILLVLIVIGILYSVRSLIIPFIIFGVIFLLYKFPPNRFMKKSDQHKYNDALKQQKARNVRKASFKVIRGNKQDQDNSDQPPKYH